MPIDIFYVVHSSVLYNIFALLAIIIICIAFRDFEYIIHIFFLGLPAPILFRHAGI